MGCDVQYDDEQTPTVGRRRQPPRDSWWARSQSREEFTKQAEQRAKEMRDTLGPVPYATHVNR